MSVFDLILRGGTGVTFSGLPGADVAVADGLIAAVGPEIEGAAGTETDADLAMVDLKREGVPEAEEFFYRHGQSPYAGRVLRGRVVRTLVRGNEAFGGGKAASGPVGRLARPAD